MAAPALVPASTYQVPSRKDDSIRVPVTKLDVQSAEHMLYADAWTSIDLIQASGVRMKNQAERFLIKRPKELFDVYQERIRRFTHEPILGVAVGWYISAMFRKDPTIQQPKGGGTASGTWYDAFLQNCDGANTTFIDVWREIFKQLCLNRTCYVLVDLPNTDNPGVIPISRADEQAQGLDKPLLTVYDARQVINFSADTRGNLDWIVIKTERKDQEFLGETKDVTTWYYFDRQEYRVYERKATHGTTLDQTYVIYNSSGDRIDNNSPMATLIDRGPHSLSKFNRVPVRRIEVPDALWLGNRAYMQMMTHINKENEYDWALTMSCLAQLLVIGQQDLTNLTITEAGFLHLPDAAAHIEWLEPKGTSFEAMQKRIDNLRQEIFRVLYLQAQGKDSSATAAGASGYSKEVDMIPASDALNGFGKVVRQGMQNVLDDVSMARDGIDTLKWDVNGFRFEVKPATISIALCDEYLSLQIPSVTAEKEVQKRTVRDVLDGYNQDVIDKACKEVDAAPSQQELKEQQAQTQASMYGQAFDKADNRATAKDELGQLSTASI
jgi:hypothetical protein